MLDVSFFARRGQLPVVILRCFWAAPPALAAGGPLPPRPWPGTRACSTRFDLRETPPSAAIRRQNRMPTVLSDVRHRTNIGGQHTGPGQRMTRRCAGVPAFALRGQTKRESLRRHNWRGKVGHGRGEYSNRNASESADGQANTYEAANIPQQRSVIVGVEPLVVAHRAVGRVRGDTLRRTSHLLRRRSHRYRAIGGLVSATQCTFHQRCFPE